MMTREEIIKEYEAAVAAHAIAAAAEIRGAEKSYALFKAGLDALRPVSRERVEKVWRGEWQMVSNGSGVCSECHRQDKIDPLAKFCRYCGAPMTDEAVEMVMERMETINNA